MSRFSQRLKLLRTALTVPIEQRSQNIFDPQNWVAFINGMTTNAGVRVNEESGLRMPLVWACIHTVANTMANFEIDTYARTDGGRQLAQDHIVHELLTCRPNPRMTAHEFFQYVQAQAEAYGRGLAHIRRDERTGQPYQLDEIDYIRVSQILVTDKGRFYRVRGYKDLIESDDMLDITPFAGGKSPIRVHRESIGLGIAAREHQQNYYGQGMNAAGFWSMDDVFAKPEDKKANEEMLKEAMHGMSRAHTAPLIQNGLKFTNLAIPQKDAQFVESSQLNNRDICGIFLVPPSIVGQDANVTHSNLEQEMRRFVMLGMTTRVKSWESQINEKLHPVSRSTFSKVNMEAILRGDSKTQAEVLTTYMKHGAMTPNEVRERLGMNPKDGGDELQAQVNQILLPDLEQYSKKISDGKE